MMRSIFLSLVLCVVASSSGLAQGTRFAHADGIAAIVGAQRQESRVILSSDVELMARLRQGQQRDGSRLPLAPSVLRQSLEQLIGEHLIALEAERVQVGEPSEEDLSRERERLGQMVGGEAALPSFLAQFGARPREIEAIAWRRARVRLFLKANLEGQARITEADIERAYASGAHPFLGQELSEVQDVLRVWLGRRALQRAVGRWVSVLRARTEVRLLVPWAARTP